LPTPSETRVKFKSAVDQCDCSSKVFAEVAKHSGNKGEDFGIVTANRKRAMSKIDPLATVRVGVVRPASVMKCHVAKCSVREGGSVSRVTLDRLTEKVECLEVPLFPPFSRTNWRNRAKV
jgi:hypothetical protein